MASRDEISLFSILLHVPTHKYISITLFTLVLEHKVSRVLSRVAIFKLDWVVFSKVYFMIDLFECSSTSFSISENSQEWELRLVFLIIECEHTNDWSLTNPDLLHLLRSKSQALQWSIYSWEVFLLIHIKSSQWHTKNDNLSKIGQVYRIFVLVSKVRISA